jgi:hypothetical protein
MPPAGIEPDPVWLIDALPREVRGEVAPIAAELEPKRLSRILTEAPTVPTRCPRCCR